MSWCDELLKMYDALDIEDLIPIAHMRVQFNIGILLSDSGLFLGATMSDERITIPCTCKSESRTSGDAPHAIHDVMSYVAEIKGYEKRHDAYMKQLKDFVNATGDGLASAVYAYLQRGTIRDDIAELVKLCNYPEEKCMIAFTTKSYKSGVNKAWTEYYLSTLPKNGICSITGEPDYIPDIYPRGIRFPGDRARLFISASKELDNMPLLSPGYIASQKICHTLQFMLYEGRTMRELYDIIQQIN